ncbi:MAG TPA: ABC transporter substrate-binding protein [Firmicutes bacterium]|nr:ABC transporter substrate-binding protein [Bacillota bacterium]
MPTGRIYIIVIMLLLLLAGCAQQPPQAANNEPAPEIKTVTDCEGRRVELPAQIEKIACLYAFTGHAVTLLGRGADIVAVNQGLPRDKMLLAVNPAIARAVVASGSDRINIEELLTVTPDVVFLAGDIADAERDKLRKSDIPYLIADFHSMQAQIDTVKMIGAAIGREEQAEKYAAYYQDVITRVTEVMKIIPETERVRLYHSINEATRSYLADSLPGEWTSLLADNVALREELRLIDNKQYASLEQILLWDPDVIFANEDGVADYIMTDSRWSALQAVKTGKVYQMPVGVSRWGHPGSIETPLGILWAAKTLYPQAFADVDPAQEAIWFYREFFSYELTADEVAAILDGRGMRIRKGEQ